MSKSKKEIAEVMYDLFRGKEDSYAVKTQTKKGKVYAPARDDEGNDLPFSPEVCAEHLSGKISIGIYPIDSNEDVRWVAMDFDGKRGNALEDAVAAKALFESKLLLTSYLERSQSGSGVHVWFFFDRPIKAADVRKVFLHYYPEAGIAKEQRKTSFDMLFPNQDRAFGKYGNLCGLPLNGKDLISKGRTAWIRDNGTPYEQQTDILMEIVVDRNKAAVIETEAKKIVAKAVPTRKASAVASATGGAKVLSEFGCNWLRDAQSRSRNLSEEEWWSAIGQFAQLDKGDVLAHHFSKDYPGYSAEETQKKFDTAVEVNKPQTVTTINEKYTCPGGCKCAKLGLRAPWEIANVPLSKLTDNLEKKIYTAQELAVDAIETAREIASGKRMGFPWGYPLLDDSTELRPGDLIIVAARRSIGKTGWLISSAALGAKKGIPQYIVSLEMPSNQLGLRLLSNISGIDHTAITTGALSPNDWQPLEQASEEFSRLPIFIDDSLRTSEQLLDSFGELVYKHGPGPIWVDYLQLVKRQGSESKKEAVDRILISYKNIAKILGVPVIALAQLNRQEETYEGDEELDSWLKDSGDIEQVADVILYIRGKRAPGTVLRKFVLHKERHRAGGLNFNFEFNQGIFRFESNTIWTPDQDAEEMFQQDVDLDDPEA